ncbi:MAG: aminopeptidase P family protein [Bryobacterales bacterium]|nr:aminopeptidase P family protein [Bryobacterales bacterium]
MRLLVVAAALAAIGTAGPPVIGEERARELYRARRAELRKSLSNGVTVLFGHSEHEAGDALNGFFQEPNFYYLSGWSEPGAILMLLPQGDANKSGLPEEILFLPLRNMEQEKWTGRKADPEDAAVRARTGFAAVMPAESMEAQLRKALEFYARVFALKDQAASSKIAALAPLREIGDARLAVARLRMKKSPEELQLIQYSTDVTLDAHRAAWKRAADGLYEYQVAATMTGIYMDRGCARPAYAPIVGSGLNSVYLHYSRNSRRMDRGEVLLMDVAAECDMYASDITRTVPVGGKFSKRQREIYEIVLGAQKAAIAAVKPGATLSKTHPDSIYKAAYNYIDSHGKDRKGESLGKYFPHGIGHHLGLEVHDANDPSMPLEEGMVITIEPGIYIPEENLGVRIEDVVLVTKDGAKVLSESLPREVGEIERAVGK